MQSHREDTKSLLQCQNGQFITIMVQILNIYHNFGIKTVNLSQLWYVSVRFITIVAMTTNLLQIWTKLSRPHAWCDHTIRWRPDVNRYVICSFITILCLLGAVQRSSNTEALQYRCTVSTRSAKVGLNRVKTETGV